VINFRFREFPNNALLCHVSVTTTVLKTTNTETTTISVKEKTATSICDIVKCQNGGTCQASGETYTCSCQHEYTGQTCQLEVGAFYTNGSVGFIISHRVIYSYRDYYTKDNTYIAGISDARDFCKLSGDGLAFPSNWTAEIDIIKLGYEKFLDYIERPGSFIENVHNTYEVYIGGSTNLAHGSKMNISEISTTGDNCVIMSNWKNTISLYAKRCSDYIAVGAICEKYI